MTIQLLHIEDNPADAFELQELLKDSAKSKKGGEISAIVTCAENLKNGIRQATSGKFDIIISDLGLPDSRGLSTIQELAAAVQKTPIIVMTTLDDHQLGLDAVNAGAQDYLIKGQVRWETLARSIRYAIERKKIENEKAQVIIKLQEALEQVKLLSGMLPICCSCKKIRDDNGYWQQIESYIKKHSEAEFSHGICPECSQKLYPELYDEQKK